jgi:ArsR family transcriptional regulator, lead/cadmium/zinc/bismuth-responsive transcriptional repressor
MSKKESASADVCEVQCFDEEKVRNAREHLPEVGSMARMFKALGDETRLKIALALLMEKELCVCDVANILDSTVATASHHLRLLRSLGLAKSRKEGKMVYYSLDDEHVQQMIQMATEHLQEDKIRDR